MGNPSRFAIGYEEDAGMAKADYRTKAGECYRMAATAPSLADQATWLKLASEWLAMSSGRGVPVLTGSTVVKREAAQTTTRAPFRFGATAARNDSNLPCGMWQTGHTVSQCGSG